MVLANLVVYSVFVGWFKAQCGQLHWYGLPQQDSSTPWIIQHDQRYFYQWLQSYSSFLCKWYSPLCWGQRWISQKFAMCHPPLWGWNWSQYQPNKVYHFIDQRLQRKIWSDNKKLGYKYWFPFHLLPGYATRGKNKIQNFLGQHYR